MKIFNYSFSFLIILVLSLPEMSNAQGGRLITENIDAPSLENNLLNIPFTQAVAIYLPPSYDSSTTRYPVVYFLPGFGDQVQDWTGGTYQNFRLKNSIDKLIADGTVKEFIVVIPSGYNFMGGSFYVNSSVTGNWEDFIMKDVTGYVEKNFRTLNHPASRGISGHSMGGYGALNLALRHPDYFGFVYSLSPGLFDKSGLSNCQLFKSQALINQVIQKEQEYSQMSPGNALTAFKSYIQSRYSAGDWDTPFSFAYGAAFSPNPNKTLPFTDYPYSKIGNDLVVDSACLKNYEKGYGDLAAKVELYTLNAWKLGAITIDYGTNDYYSWIPDGCRYFSGLLTAKDIEHNVATFNGGHQDQVRDRIERFLLPFFSQNLSYDSAATGIKTGSNTPNEFYLYQNYPNPFNPTTNIEFRLPAVAGISDFGLVTLKIYDVLGNEIKTVINEVKEPGEYKVQFNASSAGRLSSGIYCYQLMAGSIIQTKKMILMK